jgi:formylglycine-generating enzyme required for sulfatase activity
MYEVTLAEYNKFAEATGRTKHFYWRRGNRPVINVSWNDATAYTKWLSNQTGKNYRLPTEAEWEYAARAGTETKYWWGNEFDKNKANCGGHSGYYCRDSFTSRSPVGSFSANKFGLYDTSGNVSEWTCSEYEKQYNDEEKQCVTTGKVFAIRGGSWDHRPVAVRSAVRSYNWPGFRRNWVGFRVSRL